jgi:ankyrin repeat protein
MARQRHEGDVDLIGSDGYLLTSVDCNPEKRSRLKDVASLLAEYSKRSRHKGMALWTGEDQVEAQEEILQSLIVSVNQPFADGKTPLSQAVANEDYLAVKLLLDEEDIDVNAPSEDGTIPLWQALECFNMPTNNLSLGFGTAAGVNSSKKHSGGTSQQPSAPLRLQMTPVKQLKERNKILFLLLEKDDVDISRLNGQGETLLTWCVEKGQGPILKHLLRKRLFDLNCPNTKGRTPLSLAAEVGPKFIVDILLSQPNIQVNCQDNNGWTPFTWSVLGSQLDTIKALLTREDIGINIPDRNGRTALSLAAEKADSAIIQALLEKPGIDADQQDNLGRSPLSWAVKNLAKNKKTTKSGGSVSNAARIVNKLLALPSVNANLPDRGGRTPLSWCAEQGTEDVLKRLLQKEGVVVDSRDKEGRTPLFWAASRKDNDACIRILSKRDINTLHMVAKARPDLVKVLLNSGYDKNKLDSNNLPALYCAVEAGNLETTKLLISPELVNKEDTAGRTPLKLAIGRNQDIVKLLVDNSAQVDDIEPASWFRGNKSAKSQIACLSRQENTQHLVMLAMHQFREEIEKIPLGSGIRRRLLYVCAQNLPLCTRQLIQMSYSLSEGSLPLWRQYDTFHLNSAPKDDTLHFKFLSTSFLENRPQELRFCLATAFPNTSTRNDLHLTPPQGQLPRDITISYNQCSYNDNISKTISKDFFSTLDSSKIPEDGAQFLNQFVTTLEGRWVRLLKDMEKRLRENVGIILL